MTATDYNSHDDDFSGTPKFSPNSSNTESRRLVKNILSNKVFVGEYAARRYVEPLKDYRDVIVCSESETELIRFIKSIQKIAAAEHGNKKWLGITSNTETADQTGYCLWVKLKQLPFGKHWFQIRSLKIEKDEIFLQLKHLRPFEAEVKKTDVEELIALNLKEICTFTNLCEASKFSMVLILTLTTCIVKAGAFFLDFLVKMTHELSILINSLTPIFIVIVNTIAKCIGGFYWLIYMLWRGNSVPPPRRVPMFEDRYAIMDSSMGSMNMSPQNFRRDSKLWDSERRNGGQRW